MDWAVSTTLQILCSVRQSSYCTKLWTPDRMPCLLWENCCNRQEPFETVNVLDRSNCWWYLCQETDHLHFSKMKADWIVYSILFPEVNDQLLCFANILGGVCVCHRTLWIQVQMVCWVLGPVVWRWIRSNISFSVVCNCGEINKISSDFIYCLCCLLSFHSIVVSFLTKF